MTEEIAVSVKDVKKSFKVFFDKGQSLKERLLFKNRSRHETRVVLSSLSLTVKKGEAVGLVGRNGSGKSTLLKLMTRIMYPDSGSIEMKGRISSLIELGAGFHPDMSGRENIYTNAAIFGLTKREIDGRLKAIIDFSELNEFIDNPVRTYSSGMYMRLAFSVAINVNADILLIDEILAVGDASFQAKCFNKLREIKAQGTTIIIVSHSLGQIEQICDRSVWIESGVIREIGKPRDIHPQYLDFMSKKQYEQVQPVEIRSADVRNGSEEPQPSQRDENEQKPAQWNEDEKRPENQSKRYGSFEVRITEVIMRNSGGSEAYDFKCGEAVTIEIKYKSNKKVGDVAAGVGIFRNDGLNCYGTNTDIDRLENITADGFGAVIFEIKSLLLLSGEYLLDIALHRSDGFSYDYYKEACRFNVRTDYEDVGVFRVPHNWKY